MALVEGNQEVQALATKAAAQSFAYGVRLRGSHRRPQNPYPQIGKALVNRLREDAVPIMDDEAVGMQGAGAPPCTGSCNARSATDHLRWLTVRKNSTGSRQILHLNATAHPAAEWTLQQFREALPGGAG